MSARTALCALTLLATAWGAGACARPEESRPAGDQPADAPKEDRVVAHDSTTQGALQVMSVSDDPGDWFDVLQNGERALAGSPTRLNGTVELAPGTYDVVVNRTRRTVTLRAGEKTILWTGELMVEGQPEGAYWYPMQGDERRLAANPPPLNGARAFFPGTYTVFVHAGVGAPDENLGAAEVEAGRRTVLPH